MPSALEPTIRIAKGRVRQCLLKSMARMWDDTAISFETQRGTKTLETHPWLVVDWGWRGRRLCLCCQTSRTFGLTRDL